MSRFLAVLALLAPLAVASPVTAQEAPAEAESPADLATSPRDAPAVEAPTAGPSEAPRPQPTDRGSFTVPAGGVPVILPPPGTAAPAPPVGAPAPRPPRPPPPPLRVPRYVVSLRVQLDFPIHYTMDAALSAHGYSVPSLSVTPTSYLGVAVPVVEWLWLGGRIGGRGRTFPHPDHDDGAVTAGDLLATAQLRFTTHRIELGALVGAGIGYMNAQFNGRSSDQLWGRVAIELMFGVRVADEASLGVRGGWDYLEWNDMNDYGHDLDMGGPYFAIELEGHG